MFVISVDNQLHDLNTVIFALRSVPASEPVISELIGELEQAKLCILELQLISIVYQNYFERNKTSKDEQTHLKQSISDNCLSKVKDKTRTLLQLLQPLNYPLPKLLLSTTDSVEKSSIQDPNLQFEVRLFQWMNEIRKNPMNPQLLADLQTKEGFNELNLKVNEKFLGFLTYGVISDDWKYKDLRLNKTLDSLLKEWGNKEIIHALQIQVRNEFLTLKNGLLIVSKL